MLARAAFIVEGNDMLRRSRHVGDDEANARLKLSRMLLDLGGDPARLRPACGPVVEVGAIPPNMVRWPPDRTLEQVADPALQDAVRRKPDRVFDPFGFKIFLNIWIGEAGIGPKINARYLAAIARHDAIKHTLPAIGAVDVAGTKRAALQIAELIEHEPQMITGAFVMPVPDAVRRASG